MRTRLQIGWTPAEPTPLDDDLDARVDHMRRLLDGRRVVALTGAILVFVPSLGNFVVPELLGGVNAVAAFRGA